MQPDDEVCLCFHVTRRKLENWVRLQRPVRPAQLSECFGAGTGCGCCRPFLQRLFRAAQPAAGQNSQAVPAAEGDLLPEAGDYAAARSAYLAEGKGTPPAGRATTEPHPPTEPI